MSDKKKQHKNPSSPKKKWKRLFYSLVVINVFVIISLVTLIFWPVAKTYIPSSDNETGGQSTEFTVRTTKENLNELVNAYIDKLLKNSKHQYSVSFEEDVHLIGELPVFSTTVPLSVHLDPEVQKNGDVILKQKSISVGMLELPNKKIMEYMKKYLPMPNWVTVDPSEEEIYVAVTDMNIRSNFGVKLEHIDLEKNNLAFKIQIPYSSLGINLGEDLNELGDLKEE